MAACETHVFLWSNDLELVLQYMHRLSVRDINYYIRGKNLYQLNTLNHPSPYQRQRIEEIIDDEEMATTKRDLTCI